MVKPVMSTPNTTIKADDLGRVFRPVNCLKCEQYICDEYIYRGRIRLLCPNCGSIMVMVFRGRRLTKRNQNHKVNEGER